MKFIIPFLFLSVLISLCQAQSAITGSIHNYDSQRLYLYRCHGDQLLLSDSATTTKNGKFILELDEKKKGLYKVALTGNQFFYVLNNGHSLEMQTQYEPNAIHNVATDSLKVLTVGASAPKTVLYEFQHLQSELNIANALLLGMMRLYPRQIPFTLKLKRNISNVNGQWRSL